MTAIAAPKPIDASHIELRPSEVRPVEKRPDFPDRSGHYQAAKAEDERKAREAAAEAARRAEEERLRQLAAQTSIVAPAASQAPTGSCQAWMTAAAIVDQASAYQLIMRESGCNPNAVNRSSGACGIGQQLPCGKWPHPWNDPVGGMIDMQAYVFGRYGSWANALGFQIRNNWY